MDSHAFAVEVIVGSASFAAVIVTVGIGPRLRLFGIDVDTS